LPASASNNALRPEAWLQPAAMAVQVLLLGLLDVRHIARGDHDQQTNGQHTQDFPGPPGQWQLGGQWGSPHMQCHQPADHQRQPDLRVGHHYHAIDHRLHQRTDQRRKQAEPHQVGTLGALPTFTQ